MRACSVSQSCLTLCDPKDCNPPGSIVHGIFQARVLEWVANCYSRGSSQPRDQACISCGSCTGTWILPLCHPGSPITGTHRRYCSSVWDHCKTVNIQIKWVTQIFWFPNTYSFGFLMQYNVKVMFTLSIKCAIPLCLLCKYLNYKKTLSC